MNLISFHVCRYCSRLTVEFWTPSVLSVRHTFKTFGIMAQKVIPQFPVFLDGFISAVIKKGRLGLVEKIDRDYQVSRLIKEDMRPDHAADIYFIPVHCVMLEAVE